MNGTVGPRGRWIVLITLSALLLILPHGAYFVRLPQLGLSENRRLAELPSMPRSFAEIQKFPQGLEDYVRDNFPLRGNIISIVNYVRYLLGYSTTKNIIVGRDGWLFWDNGTHLAHGLGLQRLPPQSLDQLIKNLKERVQYAAARGMGYYLLPAPQQESIYPEKAPRWLARKAQSASEIDQIVDAARENGIEGIVDVRRALIAAKATLQVYRPFDTHWTGDGAYIAYRGLMTRMSRDYPDLVPLPQSSFTRAAKEWIPTTLSSILGISKFVSHEGLVYATAPPHDEGRIRFLSEKRDWTAPQIWETNPAATRTLLFLRDSFGTELLPMLKPHFRRIIIAHVQDGFFRKDLIENHQPDVMIVEVVENGLRYVANP